MIIHLIRPACAGRMPGPAVAGPWCDDTRGLNRAGCPSSVLSCTAWGFSCLANCSASGELLPRLFTLACTLLPKNRRCVFCDTFHRRSFSTATPAHFTRHGAVWCSDFPPAKSRQRGTHQRSSAIGDQLITNPKIWKPGNQENGAPGGRALPSPLSWIRGRSEE